MEVDEYLKILDSLEDEYRDNLDPTYWDQIACRWFRETAPNKTEDYGTEAWMRMGSLGILAELSGCHYRCKRFIDRGQKMSAGLPPELMPGDFDDPVHNALLDSFGYSVMLRVCVAIELGVDIPLDWSLVRVNENPNTTNEYLLRAYWDEGRSPMGSLGPVMALRSAINSWRRLT